MTEKRLAGSSEIIDVQNISTGWPSSGIDGQPRFIDST
jgi:hypothetical protein